MISLVAQLIILTLIFGFAVYACILGDPETSTIANFCMVQMPSTLLQLIPDPLIQKLSSLSEHGFQLIYLFVVLGSWSIGKCLYFYQYAVCYHIIFMMRYLNSICSIQLRISRN